jgi:hypothetical protein
MAKIYKTTDRIKVKIDEVTVSISPLTYEQKLEAKILVAEGRAKRDARMLTSGLIYLLKNSVKEVEGLENADGSKYELSFEADQKTLTQECISDLFNIKLHEKLVMVCTNLIGVIPTEFVDDSGKPIEGVSIIPTENTKSPN